MRDNTKGKIYYSMQAICLLPLLIFGILIIQFSTYAFSNAMNKEVASGLEDASHLCSALFDAAYPGDYELVATPSGSHVSYSLYKGEHNITREHSILDQIKETTNMDITLFYADTRILTTLTNWDKQRLIGTGAPDIVVEDVLRQNKPSFYDNVIINGTSYFAYYTPLRNSDGSIVGMIFVGKPSATVKQMVDATIYPIVAVGLFTMAIAGTISFVYAKNFVNALQKLKIFFRDVSTGNLNAELNQSVLKRDDELSVIGYAALSMQTSLRKLVELDTLTELLNRRSGTKKLQATYEASGKSHAPFTLVIADIDHFKQINDTYGHLNGDIVLQNVARLLREHMRSKGYAIRWGGEEFLLIYENCVAEQAVSHLQQLQQQLQSTLHTFEEGEIYVTMTFGVACEPDMNTKQLLSLADQKLYDGKNNGRNCIIS